MRRVNSIGIFWDKFHISEKIVHNSIMSGYHNLPVRAVATIKGEEFKGLDFSPFRPCVEAVEGDNPLVLITGPAGTGKSTLVRYIQHHFAHIAPQNRRCNNVAVVAPTAVAAMAANGATIHSFFRFPHKEPDSHIPEIQATDRLRAICRNLQCLVVDEISMVRADMLQAMEVSLRLNSGNNIPFGGIKIAMVGDLMQLPPVIADIEARRLFPPAVDAPYPSKFFFGAPCMRRHKPMVIHMNRIFRQTDAKFIELLHDVRMGRNLSVALPRLNEECCRPTPSNWQGIRIVPTNARADSINYKKLREIPGRQVEFEAQISGQFLLKRMPAPNPLIVKVGARVMMVKNDAAGRWINGDLGEILELDSGSIRVRLFDSGHEFDVDRATWTNYRYAYDHTVRRLASEEVGSYTQFPMTLGWAATIHKTQGATLSEVLVDLGGGTFEFGQAYVALSRCRSMNGLYLHRPLNAEDVKADPTACKWYDSQLPASVAVVPKKIPPKKKGILGWLRKTPL